MTAVRAGFAAMLVVGALLIRVVLLVGSIRRRRRRLRRRACVPEMRAEQQAQARRAPTRVLVVLGSGGHTSEMLTLMTEMLPQWPCAQISFVRAATDKHSLQKAAHVHREYHGVCAEHRMHSAKHYVIPRAREVGQSLTNSVIPTLRAFAAALVVLIKERPALLLCNGPANAAVMAGAAFCLRVIGVVSCRIIYVESFARVVTLSLSGRLLIPFVDRFIVQWAQLSDKYELAEYYGRLC